MLMSNVCDKVGCAPEAECLAHRICHRAAVLEMLNELRGGAQIVPDPGRHARLRRQTRHKGILRAGKRSPFHRQYPWAQIRDCHAPIESFGHRSESREQYVEAWQ